MSPTTAALLVTVLAACAVVGQSAPFSFLSVGDWGGYEIGKPQQETVDAVSKGMAATATQVSSQFIINVGDSAYYCGLQNVTDPQMQTDWGPFLKYPSLANQDWYSILGNHAYGYNVSALVDLGSVYSNWIMDGRYFTRRVDAGAAGHITFVFLDTNPCVSSYRSSDSSGWDPCGGNYPTCSGTSYPTETCHFHENILAASCTAQEQWLKSVLPTIPKDDWLIGVGHHTADEVDVFDMNTMLVDAGMDLYLNGHVHTMSHYSINNKPIYVTTGAGSMVAIADEAVPESFGSDEMRRSYMRAAGMDIEVHNGASVTTIFNEKVAGYTVHSFSEDGTVLTTEFLNAPSGQVVHKFSVTKSGPAPSPTPNPSPTPKASCCHYSDTTCNVGQVCCKSGCTDPASCSYTETGCSGSYGKAHGCTWESDASLCVVSAPSSSGLF